MRARLKGSVHGLDLIEAGLTRGQHVNDGAEGRAVDAHGVAVMVIALFCY
jgi:hypothetical protein